MVASEHLLECAIEKEPSWQYLKDHLEEERGHAQWLAADLLTASIDVKKTLIPAVAMQMVGSIYYLIFHVDPAALLGYMWAMESSPLSLEDLVAAETEHGKDLMRTIRYHVTHDPHHASELLTEIKSLSKGRQALIYQTADQTAAFWRLAARNF